MKKIERDTLIQQYADGPRRLREALARVPAAALKWRPAPGEWSAHEVICHCADSETNAYARIRMLVAESEPLLVGYDQDEWARRFDYHALPLEPALATVEAVRATTAALLRTLSDEAWARKGRHTEIGEYPATKWLEVYADHLDTHAQQIEKNLAAFIQRRDS
jgi:hypothetical protein